MTGPSSIRTGNRLSANRLARIGALLNTAVESGEIPGAVALVARGDSVHVETAGMQDLESRTPMQRDTIFRIASMTKPVIAVAAMILVEEARIRLDDPVDRWLPELANRKVLRSIDSRLDDTVPAERSITLRDLLTFRFGLGAVMTAPNRYPIQTAMNELGVAPGPDQLSLTQDEYIERIGRLPLIHQPGQRWMYHTGADVTAVLVARVTGIPLANFMRQRIFEPLGMKDTGYTVPESAMNRFASCYVRDASGKPTLWDTAHGGKYAKPPSFPNALVSTVDDYLAFCRMLLGLGRYKDVRILARPSVRLMMSDQLTEAQKAASSFFPGFWDNHGWGFGAQITTGRDRISAGPGAYAWSGGFGTSFVIDPEEDLTAILLIQRMMRGADDTAFNEDFFTLAHHAIED